MTEAEGLALRYPQDYPPAFVKFHEANPEVYDNMVAHARRLKRLIRNVGVRYLFEHERIQRVIDPLPEQSKTDADQFEFGLNNNFSTSYGRLIMAQEADLRTFIRVRYNEGEKAILAGQQSMEFE